VLARLHRAEANPGNGVRLERVLAAKRGRNDRLPIFLFGDERTPARCRRRC